MGHNECGSKRPHTHSTMCHINKRNLSDLILSNKNIYLKTLEQEEASTLVSIWEGTAKLRPEINKMKQRIGSLRISTRETNPYPS